MNRSAHKKMWGTIFVFYSTDLIKENPSDMHVCSLVFSH